VGTARKRLTELVTTAEPKLSVAEVYAKAFGDR
jgi:hypothetical protein